MWLLPPTLLLLSLPGCVSIRGPELVRGQERGSLTVTCRYGRGWETYGKWWCRGANWNYCHILVQTRASEEEVQGDRVSIRDNPRDRLVTVTMRDLRSSDTDTYWCGIRKRGTDRGAPVRVVVEPVLSPAGNLLAAPTTSHSTFLAPGFNIRNHYILLVFVKVPILLLLVGAILWLRGPQRVPPGAQPTCMTLPSGWTTDTAPWTEGRGNPF